MIFEPWEWRPFAGEYEKKWYDVRFPNGVVYEQLWPNAGQFRIPGELRSSHKDRVLTVKDEFEIRVSRQDPMGYDQN